MSVSRFRFVSPGIFLKEIDKSKTPTPAPLLGPVIIGRAEKGPGMRPVKVESFADFVEVFGEPTPGASSGDIWRNGNKLAPTYGAYAAKAYLANNGPVTFVRLLGYQNTNAETDGKAGWKISNELVETTAANGLSQNGGAFGLFIAPVVSASVAGNTITGSNTNAALAAVFYLNKGTIQLQGLPLGTSSVEVSGASTWIMASTTGQKEFKVKLKDSESAEEVVSFNLDPASKKFIRNVFNTNPTAINPDINAVGNLKEYFLGETFESYVNKEINGTQFAGVIVALESASAGGPRGVDFTKGADRSVTGWIVGQHKGANTEFAEDSDGEYPVQKLFRLKSLTEGEWNQNNIKISISDIKPSPNRFEKYGSFTLTIRKIDDDDQNPQPLEVYTNLNINPSSPNYIAKRIGDTYMIWDYERKMFEEFGTYPNISKYVYVEVNAAVEAGGVEEDLLPFGFYGPKKFKTVSITGAAGTVNLPTNNTFLYGGFIGSTTVNTNGIYGAAPVTASLIFPELNLVDTLRPGAATSDSTATSLEKSYFGIKTKEESTKLFDPLLKEVVRTKPAGVDVDTSTLLTYSFLFTLDDVYFSGSADAVATTPSGSQKTVAFWAEGKRASGASITAKTAFISASSATEGYGGTDFQKIARFTLPLVGGFDGFDITEKEPFSEGGSRPLGAINGTTTPETSYAYNSINVAIDSVSDPEVVEMNLATISGIQNVKLTNKLIEVCQERADTLAIIDLEGDWKGAHESVSSAGVEVRANVDTVVQNIKSRNLNSSYGCTFFPAVLAKDTSANALLGMPSSVVALGVLGSSAAATDVWFAPAGFNRGGLSNGAAGFPVVAVKQKLTSRDRDSLYEVNVNPITSFPAEGIVIFGQKTLQATATSLDRINVRRLMIYVKKEISRFASTILFDPNTQVTWNRFLNQAVPFLEGVKAGFGLTDFRVVLDETTTTPELVDRNILYAKIFLKPARAIEFVALDFILTNTGASFDD